MGRKSWKQPSALTFSKNHLPTYNAAKERGGYRVGELAKMLGTNHSAVSNIAKKHNVERVENPADGRGKGLIPFETGNAWIARRANLPRIGKGEVGRFTTKTELVHGLAKISPWPTSRISRIVECLPWKTAVLPGGNVTGVLPKKHRIVKRVSKNLANWMTPGQLAKELRINRSLVYWWLERRKNTGGVKFEDVRPKNGKKSKAHWVLPKSILASDERRKSIIAAIRRVNREVNAELRGKNTQGKGNAARVARKARPDKKTERKVPERPMPEPKPGRKPVQEARQPRPAQKPIMDDRRLVKTILENNSSLKREDAFGFVSLLRGAGVGEGKIGQFVERFPEKVSEVYGVWAAENRPGRIRRRVDFLLRKK